MGASKRLRTLTVVRRSAVDAEEERLTEIDDVIGQMEAHLSGHAREAFDRAVADESASTEPHRACDGASCDRSFSRLV